MREWGKALEGVSVLIDALFQNDPYYPKPRVGDSAYNAFKEGYLSAYPQTEGCFNIASSFLTCIEGVQAERDGRVPPAEGDIASGLLVWCLWSGVCGVCHFPL